MSLLPPLLLQDLPAEKLKWKHKRLFSARETQCEV